ncbi:hypothetical protein HOY80DRAFT_940239 [Tuber brumale]|nr:hypothetical protein HOY80DRAFT_940239 [Tuber brumale]
MVQLPHLECFILWIEAAALSLNLFFFSALKWLTRCRSADPAVFCSTKNPRCSLLPRILLVGYPHHLPSKIS